VTQPEPAPGGPPSLAEAAPTRIRHAVEQEWRESVRLLALAPRLRRQVPGRSSDGDRKDEFGWIGRSVFGPLELAGRVASVLDISDLVVGRAKVQGVADCAALPMADAIRDAPRVSRWSVWSGHHIGVVECGYRQPARSSGRRGVASARRSTSATAVS